MLLLITSFSAMADYKSELNAIQKFEKEEFINPKNYPPSKPGQVRRLNKDFYEKLLKDPVAIKYFVFLGHSYRVFDKHKADKAFALALESKFGGKKMTDAAWKKVDEVIANKVFSDSNADHKKSLAGPETSAAYFEKTVSVVNSASFK